MLSLRCECNRRRWRAPAKPTRQWARHRRSCPSALAGSSAVSPRALTRSCSSAKPSCLRMNLLPRWRVSPQWPSSNSTEFSAALAQRRSSLARRGAPRRAAVRCSTSRLRRLVLLRSARSGSVNSLRASRHRRWPRSGLLRKGRLRRVWQCRRQRTHPRPNPSVEARPNGEAARRPPGCAYHPSGRRATSPSAPPHLER